MHVSPSAREVMCSTRCSPSIYRLGAGLITINGIYSFDPNAKVNLDDFVDIIGRNFRQPKEGLGLHSSPSAHMWRTMMSPTRFL